MTKLVGIPLGKAASVRSQRRRWEINLTAGFMTVQPRYSRGSVICPVRAEAATVKGEARNTFDSL